MAPTAREVELELKKMTSLMEHATVLLTTTDDSNKETLRKKLEEIDDKIAQSDERMTSKNLSFIDWKDFAAGSHGSSDAIDSLLGERFGAVQTYAAFVDVATNYLKDLASPLLIGFEQLKVFEIVWDIITNAGLHHSNWPNYWPPIVDVMGDGPLCTVINNLLKWQLDFTQGASHAWLCTSSLISPTPYKMQVRMFRNSRAMLMGMNHLTYLDGKDLRNAMTGLPSDLFNNMCKLANEQMGAAVRTRATQPSSSQAAAPDELHGIAYCELFHCLVFMVGRCLGDLDSNGTPISSPKPWAEVYLSPAVFESAELTLLSSNTRSIFLDGCKTCDTFTLVTEGKKQGVLFALNVMRRTLELAASKPMPGFAWNPNSVNARLLLDAVRESAEDYSSVAGKEAVAVLRLLKRAAAASVTR